METPIDIGQVVELSDVKVLRYYGMLLHRFDFKGPRTFAYAPKVEVEADNPVEVRGLDEQEIGYATVFVDHDGRRLLADFFLRYDCPERLSIQNGEKLYPTVWFRIIKGPVDSISKVGVLHIKLGFGADADDRVQPLGSPAL